MIHYRNDVRGSGVNGRRFTATAKHLLRELGEERSSLSLRVVDDATIRKINREHRKKDTPTDVLSFPARSPSFDFAQDDKVEESLGDVVISVETARRQAAEYDAPLERELERLLIHGLLHLLGHDHHKAAERKRMEAEERRLAAAIGMPWPYDL